MRIKVVEFSSKQAGVDYIKEFGYNYHIAEVYVTQCSDRFVYIIKYINR